MLKDSLYYGKILLFGEYGIIQDSMGLSIPYTDYNGKLLYPSETNQNSKKSNQQLTCFYNHLLNLSKDDSLPCKLDLISFKEDGNSKKTS